MHPVQPANGSGEIREPPLAFLDRRLSASVSSRGGACGCEGCRGVAHEAGCAGTSGHKLNPGWTTFWRRFGHDLWVVAKVIAIEGNPRESRIPTLPSHK
jgi:hypothetical protein